MDNKYFFSLPLLLYMLQIPHEGALHIKEDMVFSAIRLYSPGISFSDGCLIVGNLSDTVSMWRQHPECFFLCLRDRFPNEAEQEGNVVILRSNDSVEVIYNRIMEIYLRLQQWNTDMLVSTVSNEGVQTIIDRSEEIIGNHIDVMDATFKLLAYTKNIPIDDPVTDYLLTHGYHDKKTVERFQELRRIEEFEKNDDLILSTDYEMCQYETVKRVFHRNGQIQLYVVMHCNRKRIEPGLLELFRHMLFFIQQYIEKGMLDLATFEVSQSFLRELLDKKVKTKDEAIHRSSYASIPFQKKYCLFAIAFRDHFNVPLESLVRDLNAQIPQAYVLSFRRNIVILKYVDTGQSYGDLKERMLWSVKRCLTHTPCTIGASNIFDDLWQITAAMEQAASAIQYGIQTDRAQAGPPQIGMYDFEQCFLTLILAKSINSFPDMFGNCFTMQAIKKLEDYDKRHGTSYLITLETWLDCGKKATDVCTVLHMHRNTVLYHIERIEALLETSLRNEEVCIKLKLGLLMRQSHMQEFVGI